jgi:hypothetical protein
MAVKTTRSLDENETVGAGPGIAREMLALSLVRTSHVQKRSGYLFV